MIHRNHLVVILAALMIGCASNAPLSYSAQNLTENEIDLLFQNDSAVNEMKYFYACIEEMIILPVRNWNTIKTEGIVGVTALVDIEGDLVAARVFQSVHPILDSTALETVKRATFRSPRTIINVDSSYYLEMLIPYFHDNFDLRELAIINNYALDEKIYDKPPEPVVGWDKAQLQVLYKGYSNMIRVEGETHITFLVDSKGEVGQFYIAKPFGYGAEEKAIEAIRKVKWRPAIKGEAAVPSVVTLPFEFYYWY